MIMDFRLLMFNAAVEWVDFCSDPHPSTHSQ